MDQRYAGLIPVQLERCNRRGVLATYNDHVLLVVRMRLFVVMHHLVEILAGHTQKIRDVIVSGGEYDMPRSVYMMAAEAIGRGDFECAFRSGDVVHALVLMNVQFVMIRDATVVLERLCADRLFAQAGHRDVADLKQLWGGEEYHVCRIVVDRVDNTALLDQHGLEAALLQLNATSESRRSRPDHQGIEQNLHNMLSTDL